MAQHGPDARVVTVTGEVDTLTATDLAACLTSQLAAAQLLVVDLDGVQFMGSAGLSVLFETNELATHQDRLVRLACHSRMINQALQVTGLHQHFTFTDTVPDALHD